MFSYRGSVIITYHLKALTGLRVGGSVENFEIGGLDSPVIKTTAPIPKFYQDGTDMPEGTPYIPGSSIKGKMRSSLEWLLGNVDKMLENKKKILEERGKPEEKNKKYIENAGKPCDCGRCSVCIVFGTGDQNTIQNIAGENPKELPGPPRLKVFDAYLTKESLEVLQEITQGLLTEIKTENQINRITSRAHPRKVERVPAGAIFEGKMVFELYKEGDEDRLNLVFTGMRALEDSYLGGYGSRGSGRVKFENIRLIYRPKAYYLGIAQENEIGKFGSLADIKDQEIIKELEEITGKPKNAG
ncbi:type III-A CRISPR-associated RAMP protein Csm3 [Hydrogenobacter hydrogenophilus]|uniref:CRISPR system Cms endoribonuclease Csm3 n=1 Tax=Hydrogenobacter hydrogenophilus TaxID=35835 RepID=A0A285P1J6_9AQUI|nr:type III-A CRISPR-associated RAMP protein Csm3 [Hydrogenobacter hydrogenophilus]SNZ14026.1 CRISPR-associated protein, Csm3 family [Hydrogenobacter hydrogenophilus]